MPSASSSAPNWVEGIDIIPGPTDSGGDGTHEVNLSGSFAPEYAIIGVVGTLLVIGVAFVVAIRRRLRRTRKR